MDRLQNTLATGKSAKPDPKMLGSPTLLHKAPTTRSRKMLMFIEPNKGSGLSMSQVMGYSVTAKLSTNQKLAERIGETKVSSWTSLHKTKKSTGQKEMQSYAADKLSILERAEEIKKSSVNYLNSLSGRRGSIDLLGRDRGSQHSKYADRPNKTSKPKSISATRRGYSSVIKHLFRKSSVRSPRQVASPLKEKIRLMINERTFSGMHRGNTHEGAINLADALELPPPLMKTDSSDRNILFETSLLDKTAGERGDCMAASENQKIKKATDRAALAVSPPSGKAARHIQTIAHSPAQKQFPLKKSFVSKTPPKQEEVPQMNFGNRRGNSFLSKIPDGGFMSARSKGGLEVARAELKEEERSGTADSGDGEFQRSNTDGYAQEIPKMIFSPKGNKESKFSKKQFCYGSKVSPKMGSTSLTTIPIKGSKLPSTGTAIHQFSSNPSPKGATPILLNKLGAGTDGINKKQLSIEPLLSNTLAESESYLLVSSPSKTPPAKSTIKLLGSRSTEINFGDQLGHYREYSLTKELDSTRKEKLHLQEVVHCLQKELDRVHAINHNGPAFRDGGWSADREVRPPTSQPGTNSNGGSWREAGGWTSGLQLEGTDPKRILLKQIESLLDMHTQNAVDHQRNASLDKNAQMFVQRQEADLTPTSLNSLVQNSGTSGLPETFRTEGGSSLRQVLDVSRKVKPFQMYIRENEIISPPSQKDAASPGELASVREQVQMGSITVENSAQRITEKLEKLQEELYTKNKEIEDLKLQVESLKHVNTEQKSNRNSPGSKHRPSKSEHDLQDGEPVDLNGFREKLARERETRPFWAKPVLKLQEPMAFMSSPPEEYQTQRQQSGRSENCSDSKRPVSLSDLTRRDPETSPQVPQTHKSASFHSFGLNLGLDPLVAQLSEENVGLRGQLNRQEQKQAVLTLQAAKVAESLGQLASEAELVEQQLEGALNGMHSIPEIRQIAVLEAAKTPAEQMNSKLQALRQTRWPCSIEEAAEDEEDYEDETVYRLTKSVQPFSTKMERCSRLIQQLQQNLAHLDSAMKNKDSQLLVALNDLKERDDLLFSLQEHLDRLEQEKSEWSQAKEASVVSRGVLEVVLLQGISINR